MKRNLAIILAVLAAISCNSERVATIPAPELATELQNETAAPEPTPTQEPAPTPRQILETYSNQSKVGRRGKNKIEIDIVKRGEFRTYHPDNLAVIRFYSKDQNQVWKLRQTLEIPDDSLAEADPQFQDFNGDGLKDVTFISGTAARGANEMRTLLIYDKRSDKLIHIENSAEFPNLEYSRKLNCITAWRFYGGTATDFARIVGNRLVTFATVEDFDGYRTVTLTDRKGRERVIQRDKLADENAFTRYTNYRPVE